MKTLFPKTSFTMLFFIVCLTINAQVNTNAKKGNKNAITKETTVPLTDSEIMIGIEDPQTQHNNGETVTGVVNLQVEIETLKGLSYQLYTNSGKLIKSSPINKSITAINLHNTEAENYVLNIVKGNENVKTFGFYH